MKKGGIKEHERDIRLAVTLLSTLLLSSAKDTVQQGIGRHRLPQSHDLPQPNSI